MMNAQVSSQKQAHSLSELLPSSSDALAISLHQSISTDSSIQARSFTEKELILGQIDQEKAYSHVDEQRQLSGKSEEQTSLHTPASISIKVQVQIPKMSHAKLSDADQMQQQKLINEETIESLVAQGVSEQKRYNESFSEDTCVMDRMGLSLKLSNPKFFKLKQSNNHDETLQTGNHEISTLQNLKGAEFLNSITTLPIKQWYFKLSTQQRSQAFSLTEPSVVSLIIRMVETIEQLGQGKFKFEIQQSNQELGIDGELIFSNFQFIPLINQDRDVLQDQSQALIEKEFLDCVVLSQVGGCQGENLLNRQDYHKLNTISISPIMTQDSNKLFQLLTSVLQAPFLSTHHWQFFAFLTKFSITFDEQQGKLIYAQLLGSRQVYSLAQWIAYLLELSVNFHFESSNLSLPDHLFLSPSEINLFDGHQLAQRWLTLRQKTTVIEAISKRIHEASSGYYKEDLQLLKTLMKNQDPKRFIQDICFTGINKVTTSYFKVERIFLELLMTQKQCIEVKTLKNQKKKNKRKLKKVENIVRDELLRIIDSFLRKVDSQEEQKEPFEPEDQYFKRFDSDCLSEAIMKLFDQESEALDNFAVKKDLNREPMSVFNESTDDFIENMSSSRFDTIKSPQASTNTEFAHLLQNNIFSSEAGDSSIQLQKHFSEIHHHEMISNTCQIASQELLKLQNQSNYSIDQQSEDENESHDLYGYENANEKQFQIIKPSQSNSNEKSSVFRPTKNNNMKRKKKRGRGQPIPVDDFVNSQKMNDYMKQINSQSEESQSSQSKSKQAQKITPTRPVYIRKGLVEEVKTPILSQQLSQKSVMTNDSSKKKSNNSRKTQEGKSKKKPSKGSKQNDSNANQYNQSNYQQYSGYDQSGFANNTNPSTIQPFDPSTIMQNLYQNIQYYNYQTQYNPQSIISPQISMNPETNQYNEDDEDEQCDDQYKIYEQIDEQMLNFQKSQEKRIESVHKERDQAIKLIDKLVKEKYHYYKNSLVSLKSYGSMFSNLAIDSSDVDLAVVGIDFRGSKENMLSDMKQLYEKLELTYSCKDKIEFIKTAKVPVIKLVVDLVRVAKLIEKKDRSENELSYQKRNYIDESMRYLQIDITFEDNYQRGFQPQQFFYRMSFGQECCTYIKERCKEMPELKPMVMVIKKLLQNCNLNHTYTGGLNSYSIVLITAAFLRIEPKAPLMSQNLQEFFRFYSQVFNLKKMQIDLRYGQPFQNTDQFGQLEDNLKIIDPLNQDNNPASGAYKIQEIFQIFQRAHAFLHFKTQPQALEESQDFIQDMLETIRKEYQPTASTSV